MPEECGRAGSERGSRDGVGAEVEEEKEKQPGDDHDHTSIKYCCRQRRRNFEKAIRNRTTSR